jgi:selenocysteine lyase/cysteine desulfurase
MIDVQDQFELKSAYLNTAYIGPTPKLSRDKILQIVDRGMDPGQTDLQQWFTGHDTVRKQLARLLPCDEKYIAVSTSVSEVVSHVANGLELKPGEEVLLLDGDYPSMILPWMVLAEQRGFQVRLLELGDFLEPARLARNFTPKTRAVGCSHVMFNTGARLPVGELAATCHASSDALFITDTSQSLGGMRLDASIVENVDVLIGVTYKWLLGPYGMAYACFSDSALMRVKRTHASCLHSPMGQSHSNLLQYTTEALPGARRFDRGQTPSFLCCAGLEGSLDLILEIGLDRIATHNKDLVNLFFDHVPPAFEVASPRELRSNIVCIKPADKSPEQLKNELVAQGFDVSLREGYVRISFHFFNTRAQVESLLESLS